MSASSPLGTLARRLGILDEYVDQTGRERRATRDETRVALLAAMGIDAATEESARQALESLDQRERDELLPTVRVATAARLAREGIPISPQPGRGPVDWRFEIRYEDGTSLRRSGRAERHPDGSLALPSPDTLPLGYHDLRLEVEVEDRVHTGDQMLAIVPERCITPADLPGAARRFGVVANLYSVRSSRNWGVGDASDLAALLDWSGSAGAAFVGVNPLHALRNVGYDYSPYSPVSRLFRNVIYIDVTAVPELSESDEGRAILARDDVKRELGELRSESHVRYERVWRLKRMVLEALHRTFAIAHRGGGTVRGQAYDAYIASQGTHLTTFATWMALDDHFQSDDDSQSAGGGAARPAWWREWPEEFRDPASPAVVAFRQSSFEEYDFHRWLQFELDRQLENAARAGRAAGMAIGLYEDLAIGSSPNGSDTWAYPDLFLRGVSVGAPPDEYAAQGQNWGLPPIDPRRLRADRYRYWIMLLRSSLAHAGAVRIDHVLGLFRQFWIPEGKPGSAGAYVRFPVDDLLGILALESVRQHAVVVGEDLGTVPPEVPPTLKRWGVLSSRVLFFERDLDGGFRSSASYEPLALAVADTHDMHTLRGYWEGTDLDVRRRVGLIASDEALEAARQQRRTERGALVQRLQEEGTLAPSGDGSPPSAAAIARGVHRFLCRSPAELVGLSLDDLAAETDPVNVPGVGLDVYPSWSRRMRVPLETLVSSREVREELRCDR